MEEVDTEKAELDALDFGILCHAALEAMGREPALRNCTDERVLREFLLARVEEEAAARYGASPPPPLIVQLESARQRLSRAAAVQAAVRAEGWVIERVEEKFSLSIGALTVAGKADRIERHEVTGEVRIVDYKTSDRPVPPESAHLRRRGRAEQVPDFALAGEAADGFVWADLQLPLYLRAFASAGTTATAAYFNLPKAAGDTGILAWSGYTRELDASAWRCAEGVAAAIAAGEFWPPNENMDPDWDDFAPLFHHGAADSVAWEEAGS
jgi:ATP-dependent helicase/nuclease subunit B